jgi:hypothetical protein
LFFTRDYDGDGLPDWRDDDDDNDGRPDGDDDECPWDLRSRVESRSNCDYFYIYYCQDGNWYDYIQYENKDQLIESKINTFLNNHGISLTQTQKNDLKNRCNVFSPDFEKCLSLSIMNDKHNYLTQYPDYESYTFHFESQFYGEETYIEWFYKTYGFDKYMATVAFYENYLNEVGVPPNNLYQWQLMMEVFIEELGPLALELIPGGIGDMIGAYNSFKSGHYWEASLSVVLVVVPGDEIIKVWQKYTDIKKGMKAVLKFINVYQKLAGLPGVQKVFNKLPQAWKDLPGSKLADTQTGLKWTKAENHVMRIMEGNPSSPYPNSQNPYGRFVKNGSYYDINKNPVNSEAESGHIPIGQLTDDFLDWFFN